MNDEILQHLALGSDTQLDPCVKEWINEVVGKPEAEQEPMLADILNKCAHGALCTDFVMQVLHDEWALRGGTGKSLAASVVRIEKEFADE